ncbi:uncharacterized protein APUU_31244A [Aspergillus puulaauensis]|uniref:Uncharacterized protein n=1 Tax=Aspergillus puulaauensis TaxID=1220207 RepID=A0A7R8AKM8_9EURO|nr:uncharacterized protein APUU_31244A [Aspergillus puulaauensis]BCS23019.1 hypothetical protein APUU_31244A [Aspergillus puulaauensis]
MYIEGDGFIERTVRELEFSGLWASIQELAVNYVYGSFIKPNAVLRLLESAKQLQGLSFGQHKPRYWDGFMSSAISTPLAFQLRSLTIHGQMFAQDPAEPRLKDFIYRQRDTLETVRFADVHLSSLGSRSIYSATTPRRQEDQRSVGAESMPEAPNAVRE